MGFDVWPKRDSKRPSYVSSLAYATNVDIKNKKRTHMKNISHEYECDACGTTNFGTAPLLPVSK